MCLWGFLVDWFWVLLLLEKGRKKNGKVVCRSSASSAEWENSNHNLKLKKSFLELSFSQLKKDL